MEFMKSVVVAFLLFAGLCSHAVTAKEEISYQKSSTPEWVNIRLLNMDVAVPIDLISQGTFYRIVDDQVKVTDKAVEHHYRRIATTIVNQKGLDDNSQIQIDFDPTYESLIIHDISVVRNGTRVDRYDSSEISVFFSEDNYARQIYNGVATFNVILNDVQVGDTVDYSYTVTGSNPVYKGLFSKSRVLVWTVPVQDQYHRVLWGKSQPLHVEQRNGNFPLTETQSANYRDYSVHAHMATPQRFSSQSPAWNLPYHEISYTETGSWKQVNDWALDLYNDLGTNSEVKELADSIRQQTTNPEQQLVLALNYVQDKIRYVGIQIGDNSHLPTPASETLRLKYGDCKDKTVLMLALMQELGIEGYPALVNSEIGQSLNQLIPSIKRFDHVIVNAVIGEDNYWLDPTMSNQIGPLESLYQPDFGHALVVKQGEDSLVKMDASTISDIQINETYTIPADVKEPAELQVTTRYLGWQTQRILSQIQNHGAASLGEQYLEYYQRSFPGASSLMPIELESDNTTGWVTLEEHYRIETPFTETEDGHEIYFYSNDIRNELDKPKDVDRNAPFVRNYPKKITNKIVLKLLDQDWDIEADAFTEDNPFFTFSYDAKYENHTLTLEYRYESKQDHVSAGDIDAYLEARSRARDHTTYHIIHHKQKEPGAASSEPASDANEEINEETSYILWYMAVAAVLFCVMLVDWRFSATSRKDADTLWFQPVPLSKFYFLTFITFGAYGSYWVYRNWYLIDKHEKQGIWPIARGIFSVFWLYPLYSKFSKHQSQQSNQTFLFSVYLAVFLAALYFALGVVSGFSDNTTLNTVVYALVPLVFVPFIIYVNQLYPRETSGYKNGAKVGLRHICATLICLPLMLISIGQITNLTPSDKVVDGDALWSHDVKFMHQQNILSDADTIQYFYSNALFSIRKDGNGFTQHNVFSYWEEDDKFAAESARYGDIEDIKIDFANSEDENTTVTVIRKDGTDFLLYVSAVEKKDKVFTEALLSNWKASQEG